MPGKKGFRDDPKTRKIVGAVLTEMRVDASMTQERASEKLEKWGKSALGSWERGERAVSTDEFEAVCGVYGQEPRLVIAIIERRVELGRAGQDQKVRDAAYVSQEDEWDRRHPARLK